MAKKGLGKGLGSLFEDTLYEDSISSLKQPKERNISPAVTSVKLSDIEPNSKQPRKNFDEEKLKILADSIRENGLIQPIIIAPLQNGMYKIVAGERRWRAAKMAGLTQLPSVIREYTDEQIAAIALIENLQREDLNPIEEALGYKALLDDFSMTQEEISKRLGKSRSAVTNSLRLLNLEDPFQKMLIDGDITGGHARAILSLTDSRMREDLADSIISEHLNVRQAELLAKKLQEKQTTPDKPEKKKTAYQLELEEIQNQLSSNFGTKVKISSGRKKGKIEIEYYGNEDLERILELFQKEN